MNAKPYFSTNPFNRKKRQILHNFEHLVNNLLVKGILIVSLLVLFVYSVMQCNQYFNGVGRHAKSYLTSSFAMHYESLR